MNTPKKYKQLITKGILTEDMLAEALYSASKRAKYHRDMERRYRDDNRLCQKMNPYYYDKYDNAEKSKQRKEHYYQQKDKMLELLKPIGIRTSIHYKVETIFEYDYEYRSMKNSPNVIRIDKMEMYYFSGEITYYDRDISEYVTEYQERYIHPNDTYKMDKAYRLFDEDPTMVEVNYIEVNTPQSYDVYLFFECGNHTFHKPVRMGMKYESEFESVLAKVKNDYPVLKVSEVPDLFVQSVELTDVLSSQFTDKVVALIESGNFVFENAA